METNTVAITETEEVKSDKYTILEVGQGTREWKEERFKRVTASQVPALMGVNPSGYQKAIDVFKEKVSGKEEKVDSFKLALFQKGHDAEIKAREWVEEKYSLKFPAMTIVSNEIPDLMASLDGFSVTANIIFEAKYMGQKNIEAIREGKGVPDHHYCQIQAQLLVSSATHCIYFATDGVNASVMTKIYPDSVYQTQIMASIYGFMDTVREFKNKWDVKKSRKKGE